MIENLLQILRSKKLLFEIIEKTSNAFIITFDVWAKPGARSENIFISNEGILVIQTRSKPIDGEANLAIVEDISNLIGIPKSQVEIFRGDKSRLKKIKIKVSFTANKKEIYYQKKFIAISSQEVLD